MTVSSAAWCSSGGKDSMLALIRARERDLDVRTMLTMFDKTGERNRSHGVPRRLVEAQVRALGLTLLTPAASWAQYESILIATLRDLRAAGTDRVVFGDIDLVPHQEWEER